MRREEKRKGVLGGGGWVVECRRHVRAFRWLGGGKGICPELQRDVEVKVDLQTTAWSATLVSLEFLFLRHQ